MKKIIAFLITLTLLVTAVTVYVYLKTESEKPKPIPTLVQAGQRATFKHPEWVDTVVFEKNNRMHREEGDWATVTSFENGILSVSWDRWDVERYQKSGTESDTFELITE